MPCGSREQLATVALALTLACGLAAPGARLQAQSRSDPAPVVRPIYYNNRSFRIPVTVQPEGREIVREVRLWVSDDYGYHWKEFGQTGPTHPEFPFRATRDAEYWFALQTVDRQGRIYPADDRQAEPTLKVIVDTIKPTVMVRPLGRKGAAAGVSWEVQDENLRLNSLSIAYQPANADASDWRLVPLQPDDYKMTGSKVWDSGASGPLRIRVSVKDRAGNERAEELLLLEGTTPNAAMANAPSGERPPPVAPISARTRPGYQDSAEDPFGPVRRAPEDPAPLDLAAGSPDPAPIAQPNNPQHRSMAPIPPPSSSPDRTLLAPKPQFPLKYEVENAGPGGVARVQLWVTQDGGQTWFPQPEDTDKQSPYPVDLKGDGTFGLWLVVQGVSGLGDLPPTPGTRPNLLVEVDSLAPVLEIDPPRVGTGSYAGKVMVTWRASDPHLGSRPVSLTYQAEDAPANAPWIPIDRVENTGQYIWTVPPGAPPRFRVRVEVADSLDHRSVAVTGPILVDRARPTGKILGLDIGGDPIDPAARR